MIRQNQKFINSIKFILDSLFHVSAFVSAMYYANVEIDIVSTSLLYKIAWVIIIYGLSYKYFGLYGLQRSQSLLFIDYNIIKASLMAILIYNIFFLLLKTPIHAKEIVFFFFIDTLYLITLRMLLMIILRTIRKRGFNQKFVVIAGAGELGKMLLRKIRTLDWTGLQVVGYLDDNIEKGTVINNVPVLGMIDEAKDIIKTYNIDEIIICLPMRAYMRMEQLMESVGTELVKIRIIPDIYQYPLLLKSTAGMLADVPIITLNDSLFNGWRRVVKRAFDIVFSLLIILLIHPILIIIAILVKLSSPGPILYRQERMGLDGKKFDILKFRSMPVDIENKSGAVWAKKGENRATTIGAFLRKTSLDELPQFFNVLAGNMSVVGPRPERPVFIEKFKLQIPKYMLRHMMKAGITGWAQVNGWRGNTSLDRRIDHDLYYIENWSLLFDMKIIFLTLFKGFVGKSVY